jgi:glutathione S-transferase
MALPKLLYFAARGRAEVTRLVLAEAAVPYEEENFPVTDFPALKKSGRLPFGAVPLWEEDGWKLAQSAAIAAHIARGHGLYGKNEREVSLIEQALGGIEDVRNEYRRVQSATPEKRPEIRAELTSTSLPRWFGHLERLLVSNGGGDGFLVGDALSVADLSLWYALEIAKDNGFGATLSDCPKLGAFYERIAARPRIAAYLKSPKRPSLTKLPA